MGKVKGVQLGLRWEEMVRRGRETAAMVVAEVETVVVLRRSIFAVFNFLFISVGGDVFGLKAYLILFIVEKFLTNE